MVNIQHVKEEYPLKQGLKLCQRNYVLLKNWYVKEEYPLKQGLKLIGLSVTLNSLWSVKEEYPLKQGLKQYFLYFIFFF